MRPIFVPMVKIDFAIVKTCLRPICVWWSEAVVGENSGLMKCHHWPGSVINAITTDQLISLSADYKGLEPSGHCLSCLSRPAAAQPTLTPG